MYPKDMNSYWLIKSEPDEYSIDDLARDGRSPWTGVRNYQARNFMRDGMRPGDTVLYYHSSTAEPGIVGTATVASEPYPDPTAFNAQDSAYDPKSDPEKPTWILVDMAFESKFSHPVTLSTLKNDPFFADMRVVQRGNRLSVMPVEERHFRRILELGNH